MIMHDIWLRSPLLRVVLPLLAGIYAYDVACVLEITAGALFVYSCYFLARNGINRHWSTSRNSFHIGIFYSLLWFLVGIAMQRSTNRFSDTWHALHIVDEELVYAIRLTDEPIQSGNRWRVQGEVLSVFRNDDFGLCRGRIALTLENDTSRTNELHVDDVLIARMMAHNPAGPRNPMDFDYANYLRHQDVWLQAYVSSDNWMVDTTLRRTTIRGTLIRWREQLLEKLSAAKIESREVGVLSALVLGKSSAIDREVMQTYAVAGVVHVLAVSGLHVALIYMLLKPLFDRIWGRSRARNLKTLIPILLLWFYAAMTGFSPSVLRAAWMFSFVIVADNFGLRNTIYNAMSASALLLLAFDPHIAFSMGFMLSFLAVIGIAAIHPPLHRMLYLKSRFGKWLWELSSISISAQLATLPLTMYLFHQFPTWFLLTNALIIPLSTLILYLALFFFVTLVYSPLASFVGGLLGLLTRIMNDLMQWSASWPYALIDRVHWELWEAVLCALLIVGCCFTILAGKRRASLFSLVLILVWVTGNTVELIQKREQSEVCFHSSYSGESISAYYEGTLSMVGDAPLNERGLLNYRLSLEPSLCDTIGWGSSEETSNVMLRYPWLQVNDCLLFIADTSMCGLASADTSVIVYFSDNGKPHYWKYEELRNAFGHTVILGNNLSRKRRSWLHKQLRDSCRVLDLSDGAVIWRAGLLSSYRNE